MGTIIPWETFVGRIGCSVERQIMKRSSLKCCCPHGKRKGARERERESTSPAAK